jgi:hypothetical protein
VNQPDPLWVRRVPWPGRWGWIALGLGTISLVLLMPNWGWVNLALGVVDAILAACLFVIAVSGIPTYIGPRCCVCNAPVPDATPRALPDVLGLPPSRTICPDCITRIRLDPAGGPDA